MKLFKDYKYIIPFIALVGIMLFAVLRLDTLSTAIARFYSAVLPLLLGAFIAYMLNIIVVAYEKYFFPKSQKKWVKECRRAICILGAILSVLMIISFILRLVLPQTINSLSLVIKVLPDLYASFYEWAQSSLQQVPFFEEQWKANAPTIQGLITKGTENMSKWLGSLLSIVEDLLEALFHLAMGFIFSLYILLNKEALAFQFERFFKAYLPDAWVERLEHAFSVGDSTFRSFFVGQFVDAIILGAMVTVGMLAFQLPYATNVGCIVGLTALIPIVGAYLGGLIGLIILASSGMWEVMTFLILLIIMQQIEGNFVYPKVVGQSVGLPGIWVFASITVGGALYGITGVLLSVPLMATVYKLIGEDVCARLRDEEDSYL